MSLTGELLRRLRDDLTDCLDGKAGIFNAYGAVGNGIADDRAPIQSAIDRAHASGGGVVYLPPGAYLVSAANDAGLVVHSNVTLRGAGRACTTVKAGATSNLVHLVGLDNVTVEDLTIDGNNVCDSPLHIFGPGTSDIHTGTAIRRCHILNSHDTYALRVSNPVADLLVEDCLIDGVASVQTNALGSNGISFHRNRAPWIQVYGNSAHTNPVAFENVSIRDNYGAASENPIELFYCRNVIVSGNLVDGPGMRGISTAGCQNMVIANNVVRNQSAYGVELNGGSGIVVTGNTFQYCGSMVTFTGVDDVDAGTTCCEDVSVTHNVHTGTGRAKRPGPGATAFSVLAWQGRRILIEGNTLRGLAHSAGIAAGYEPTKLTQDVVVRNNVIHIDHAESESYAITIQGSRCEVSGNRVIWTRPIRPGFSDGNDAHTRVVCAVMGACDGVTVRNNEVWFADGVIDCAPDGTATTGTMVAIGTDFASPGPLPRSVFKNNRVVNGPIGFRSDATSADLIWDGNDGSTCVTDRAT